MSVFSPLPLSAGSEQKRAVIQQLMEQYQQAASRAASLSSGASTTGAVAGVGLPFHGFHPFAGIGRSTQLGNVLGQALAAALGPGGYGQPIAGVEQSLTPGGMVNPIRPVDPRLGGPLVPRNAIPFLQNAGPIPTGGVGTPSGVPSLPSIPELPKYGGLSAGMIPIFGVGR